MAVVVQRRLMLLNAANGINVNTMDGNRQLNTSTRRKVYRERDEEENK